MAGYFQGQGEFRIEELTGRRRVVVLRGSALPFRPVTWKGDQRIVTTWYAGNARATQQVLGPTEMPTEVEGLWRVRRLLDEPVTVVGAFQSGFEEEVSDPQVLRDVLDAIRRGGAEVMVTWGGLVRTGRVKSAEFPHDRLEDIGWKASFEWNGRGETRPRAFANPAPNDVGLIERLFQAFADAVNATNRVFDAVEGTDPTSTAFSARTLVNGARRVQAAVSRASALADRSVRVAKLPLDVAHSFSSIAVDIRAQVRNVADGVANTPTELLATRDDAEHVLDAYTAMHTARYQAERLADEATRQEQARLARVESDFLDVIIGRAGTSLRDLARRYYGDPDAWQEIADANNLDGSVLAGGIILVVPRRRGGR